MQTEADRIADALRLTLNDLHDVVAKIRYLNDSGKPAPKASARYAGYVRRLAELVSQGIAIEMDVSAFDELLPIAYRDQLVGFTAEQKRALEWRGVSDCLRTNPVSIAVPAAAYERAAA
ncbi:hypothetical protein [Shinella sp. M31]|uniref:hypothetical protein n=1 Tax=Shinella sp. M31 TaxID=3368615 RepID=UPI003BA02E83